MGFAVAPSTHSTVYEFAACLFLPAIVEAGNPLDYESRIMITSSTDGGRTWETAKGVGCCSGL